MGDDEKRKQQEKERREREKRDRERFEREREQRKQGGEPGERSPYQPLPGDDDIPPE
jgi:hypothetical protein